MARTSPKPADPASNGLVRSPAALLRTRRQTVPSRSRTTQLEQLNAWSAEPGFGALPLHEPGGQGKTRLAQHLANTLTARKWSVLCLRPDTELENPAVRLFPAVRAPGRVSGGRRLHHKDVVGVADAFHSHIDPGKQHSLDRVARHPRKDSAETIPRSPR
ncbi:P-loop NTPase family protein [Streptomyces cellulosae]|uniref:ATP-binding protein n=1 Tax=Streptomyces cellulosae TaxID=1968 RepID=A0ABW7YHJ8_STRCE